MQKMSQIVKPNIKEPARFSLVWLVPLAAALVSGWLIWQQYDKMGPSITVRFRDGTGLVANQTIVKYRGVRIGSVHSVALSTNIQQVEVRIQLDRSARDLARAGSLFWVVRPEVGAGGLHGLETIVSGPYVQVEPGDRNGKIQQNFDGLSEAPLLPPTDGGTEFILSTGGVRSLAHGSPVYYRGMEVGSVEYLGLSQDSTAVDVHVFIKAKFAPLVRENTVFWNAGGINMDLHLLGVSLNAENLKSVIIGGIAFATPNDYGKRATSNTLFALHDKLEVKWLEWSPAIIMTNAITAMPANEAIPPLNVTQ